MSLEEGSGSSVAWPVSWNSRSSNAIARAVAAKATTRPVITSACGTGSLFNPAPAPRRAMTPNSRKTPLPSRLNAKILRSGRGSTIRPNNPRPIRTTLLSPNRVVVLIMTEVWPVGRR